jgi:hypothetical protein
LRGDLPGATAVQLAQSGDDNGYAAPIAKIETMTVRHNRSEFRLAAALATFLVLCVSPASAQNIGTELGRDRLMFPNELKYVLEIPWCKKWDFGCFSCAKRNGRIVCDRLVARCDAFLYDGFTCIDFDVEKSCLQWSDGCNTCTRWQSTPGTVGCTSMACRPYVPELTCLLREAK